MDDINTILIKVYTRATTKETARRLLVHQGKEIVSGASQRRALDDGINGLLATGKSKDRY